MYRHCIYCSSALGANEALERFPVGRTLAFDAARGRLWAVCRGCARWNLAPLEERWEAVEEAERRFADTRLRVQSENVGLAKLRDGTRLVRIGAALPGEVAAWRYGVQFRGRRRRYLMATGVTAAGVVAASGLALAGMAGVGMLIGAKSLWDIHQGSRVVDRVPAGEHQGAPLRRRDLNGARMAPGEDGGMGLVLPRVYVAGRKEPVRVEVDGPPALSLLGKALLLGNRRGATDPELEAALRLVSADLDGGVVRRAAELRGGLGISLTHWRESAFGGGRARVHDLTSAMEAPMMLAVEMSLHERSERRALEGELALLEAAWREAEEIAAIADGLALPPGRGKEHRG